MSPCQSGSSEDSWKKMTVSLLPSPSGEKMGGSALTVAEGGVRSMVIGGGIGLRVVAVLVDHFQEGPVGALLQHPPAVVPAVEGDGACRWRRRR